MVPHPGFRVDRFTDRTQQSQAGKIVLLWPVIAPLDEGSNCRRCRVEDTDTVFFDDLPEPSVMWPVGGPFVHHRRGTVRQRAVNDVTVPGDPANVGGTPVGIFFFQVEDPFRRHHRTERVSAGCMQNPLGFPRTSRGVENEQRMFGVEFHGIAIGVDV